MREGGPIAGPAPWAGISCLRRQARGGGIVRGPRHTLGITGAREPEPPAAGGDAQQVQQACQDAAQVPQEAGIGGEDLDEHQLRPADVLQPGGAASGTHT